MAKTEVYSWRVDPALKRELEAAARADETTVAAVIEKACRAWLRRAEATSQDEKEQRRLRKLVAAVAGTVDGPCSSATNENIRRAFAAKHFSDEMRRRAPRSRR